MAVKIRLARTGKTNQPFYRVVAIDEHLKRDGRAIETLGSYNPHKTANKLEISLERVNYWLSVGAKPTLTVSNLIKKYKKS